jgi:hypothetical protein
MAIRCLGCLLPCWEEKEEDRDDEVNGKKLGAFEPIAFAVSAD